MADKIFKVTYDDGGIETLTMTDLLAWPNLTLADFQRLQDVLGGKLRRLSTDRNGIPCDIELTN